MMKAFEGKCIHCGRDDGYDFSNDMLPANAKEFLREDSYYLVRIDTGHLGEYRFRWDVAHWIAGAFTHHIHGTITHFQMLPLPPAMLVANR